MEEKIFCNGSPAARLRSSGEEGATAGRRSSADGPAKPQAAGNLGEAAALAASLAAAPRALAVRSRGGCFGGVPQTFPEKSPRPGRQAEKKVPERTRRRRLQRFLQETSGPLGVRGSHSRNPTRQGQARRQRRREPRQPEAFSRTVGRLAAAAGEFEEGQPLRGRRRKLRRSPTAALRMA